jgi:hypothetical protein
MRTSTFILCLIGGLVIFTLVWGVSNMSNNTASIEQNAQIEAARQQSLQVQAQTEQHNYAAQLNAQLNSQTNGMGFTIAIIVVGAILVVVAAMIMFGILNWIDNRQITRHTLMLQERQALLLEQNRTQQEQFILLMQYSVPSSLSLPDKSTVENTVLNIPSIVRNNQR